MTIGELYDKFDHIKALENERNAYLEACIKITDMSREEFAYVLEHKNIRAPKKEDTELRRYYEKIDEISKKIVSIRSKAIKISSKDIEEDN